MTPDQPEVTEILRLRSASNAAIAAHDVAGLTACVAPDVCVTTGNGQVCSGRASMAERFAAAFARQPDLVYQRTPQTVEISAAAPLACEQGRWAGRWTESGMTVQVGGSYAAMWRRENEGWRIRSELYVLLERSAHPAE